MQQQCSSSTAAVLSAAIKNHDKLLEAVKAGLAAYHPERGLFGGFFKQTGAVRKVNLDLRLNAIEKMGI